MVWPEFHERALFESDFFGQKYLPIAKNEVNHRALPSYACCLWVAFPGSYDIWYQVGLTTLDSVSKSAFVSESSWWVLRGLHGGVGVVGNLVT